MKKASLGIILLLFGFFSGLYIQEKHTAHSRKIRTVERISLEKNVDFEVDDATIRSIKSAKRMLVRQFGSEAPFAGMPSVNIAKYLNHVVFNHCATISPHTGEKDINELFDFCKTACGGYSYVFRGLLAAHGIKTREMGFVRSNLWCFLRNKS